jgi:hypothetical protein
MSAERPNKTRAPESLPEAEGPERKRVLNVLAQRRYREYSRCLHRIANQIADADVSIGQRRKEKIAALEAHAKGVPSLSTTPPQPRPSDSEKVVADSNLIDSEAVEEIAKRTTESSFAMFDFDEDPFGPGPMQPFHGQLTTPLEMRHTDESISLYQHSYSYTLNGFAITS